MFFHWGCLLTKRTFYINLSHQNPFDKNGEFI
jgi:hypothetical protein